MRINLRTVELVEPCSTLGSKKKLAVPHFELYLDDKLPGFVHCRDSADRYNLVPISYVRNMIVASESVPKHQPVGTPEARDTPKGRKKHYSMKTAKAELAKRTQKGNEA